MILELAVKDKPDPAWKSMKPDELAAYREKIQFPHVKKVMSMTDDELESYHSRPLPDEANWKREADAEKVFAETMAGQPGRLDSISAANKAREQSKNTTGDAFSDPGFKGSASTERKEQARQAFSFTPPAELTEVQKKHLTELNKIVAYDGPVPTEEKSVGFFGKIKAVFKSSFIGSDSHVSWRDAYTKGKK